MALPKILSENRLWDTETIIAASSEQPNFPAENLLDQQRQKTWRSAVGWTIVAGFNDKIDFERPPGSLMAATIAPGTYTSGADMAAAVVAALEAADSSPVWECDYGVAAANKFRIKTGGAAPNFVLRWGSGPNFATNCREDLGFGSGDLSGNNTYTATGTAYQSRHFVKIHRSDGATIGVGAITLIEHSFIGLGTVKLQGSATDSWGSPTSFTLTGITSYDPIGNTISSTLKEWWRLLIDQVQGAAGYSEIGIWWLESTLDAPTVHPSIALANEPGDFSAVEVGIDGTHFVDQHRRQDRWGLVWETLESADVSIFDTIMDARGVGENWILWWDGDSPNGRGNGTTGVTYGFYPQLPRKQYVPANYWTVSFPFYEAL